MNVITCILFPVAMNASWKFSKSCCHAGFINDIMSGVHCMSTMQENLFSLFLPASLKSAKERKNEMNIIVSLKS